MILERLDRGFAIEGWMKLFPMTYEKHLTAVFSDHTPLLFNISNRPVQGASKRQFRFENMWVRHSSCETIIKGEWQNGKFSNIEELFEGLFQCG